MALHRKIDAVLALQPDVAVISEYAQLCLLKTAFAAETVAFRTGTGYRPWHVRDRLSSPPFSAARQLPWARSPPA